jgi:heptosyltransferase II
LVFLNRTVGPKMSVKHWKSWDKLKVFLEEKGCTTASQKSMIIEDFIFEIQKSKFVISTDSLGLHIALALGKPVLGLFGPTEAKDVAGLDNYIQKDLNSITAIEVFNKFKKMWDNL